MSIFSMMKTKLGMAAPHMKPADVTPWGEFGWVVDQWYRLGGFWRTAFMFMTVVAGFGWYLYVDAETTHRPNPRPINLSMFDHAGVPVATYTTYQGEEPPAKVRETTIKNTFFRMRRVHGSMDAVADNLNGLTAYLGKPAEAKIRACLVEHPVEEMVDTGIRREVLNIRYVPGRINAAAVSMYWTEIERDQLDNVRARRDIEATATVRVGGESCPDADKNPYCIVIEEFSWDVPGC
jgi:hypothetical protein